MSNGSNVNMNIDNPSPFCTDTENVKEIYRYDFPKDFTFGSSTSAYQVEGAYNVHGKGRSNWDVFAMNRPDKIDDGSNGCRAIDQYNMFKEDIALMKKAGFQSYRFSIAWSRILPGGSISAGICKNGIQYYNDLIDKLWEASIEPYVTLFHWDLPEILEQEYRGFLHPDIWKHFREYADVCFWNFGDRVKRWITLNEPWSYTVQGYVYGAFPPCRGATVNQPRTVQALLTMPIHRSRNGPFVPTTEGDPGREPYIVAHNLIVSHAHAVDVYRSKYAQVQGGEIGMTNMTAYFAPHNPEDNHDKLAAERARQFWLGWFVQPMITGEYPPDMVKIVKDRLTPFTDHEKQLVKGSYDFLGINYYTTYYATDLIISDADRVKPNYITDMRVQYLYDRNGKPIGPQGGSSWLYIVPWGIRELMYYMKKTYNDPHIYITENGVDELNNKSQNVTLCLNDETRIKYHRDHLREVRVAMNPNPKDPTRGNVRVKGYFLWSLMDNYEWAAGYTVRFGIYIVDFTDGHLTRYPKNSAIWWMKFNKAKKPEPETEEEEKSPLSSLKRLRSSN